jgi:hypothetical protein
VNTTVHGPPDRVAVVLAVADARISAGVEEAPHDLDVALRRRLRRRVDHAVEADELVHV